MLGTMLRHARAAVGRFTYAAAERFMGWLLSGSGIDVAGGAAIDVDDPLEWGQNWVRDKNGGWLHPKPESEWVIPAHRPASALSIIDSDAVAPPRGGMVPAEDVQLVFEPLIFLLRTGVRFILCRAERRDEHGDALPVMRANVLGILLEKEKGIPASLDELRVFLEAFGGASFFRERILALQTIEECEHGNFLFPSVCEGVQARHRADQPLPTGALILVREC